MATSMSTHHIRLALFQVKGGTVILRELLKYVVNNTTANGNIDTYLSHFIPNIDKKSLRKDIFNVLFSTGKSDINEWDVSILVYILNTFCTVEGKLTDLKKILRKEKGNDLDAFLTQNKSKIDILKNNSVITDEQYVKLFPTTHAKTHLATWDIELLTSIVLNLCTPRQANDVKALFIRVICTEAELQHSSGNVVDFLKTAKPKTVIDELKANGKLTDAQYEDVYPTNGLTSDPNTWDCHLLCIIVLNVCESLPMATAEAVETIRVVRNDIAHTTNFKATQLEVMRKMDNLTSAIGVIVNTNLQDLKETMDTARCASYFGELDPSAITLAKDCFESIISENESQNKVICDRLDSVNATSSQNHMELERRMEEMKGKMDQVLEKLNTRKYNKVIKASENINLRAELHISSNDEDVVKKTEMLVLGDLKRTLSEDSLEANDERLNTVKVFKKGIEDCNVKVKDVELGSVILELECRSVEHLLNFIDYFKSGNMQDSLLPLQTLLQRQFGQELTIAVCLNCSDLQRILDEIDSIEVEAKDNTIDAEQFKRTIHMNLETNTVLGIEGILQIFKCGDATNNFNKMSEELSEHIGKPVKITGFISNMEELLGVLESAARLPSENLSANEILQAPSVELPTEKCSLKRRFSEFSSMSEDDEPQRKKVKRSGTWAMLDKIDKCRNRYKEVLSKLKKAIEDEITKNPDSRVREWSEEISCLEENIKFPETKIGMIGSTGVGKSSLINAILDHKELLPTSGSKACTSAVIEVMENTLGTDFEAEIVFLEEEEWKNELRMLLQDLRNQDGQIENYSTDTGEEYRVSLAKIQAVYGGDINITSAEDLSQLTSPITASLGKVEKIKCASAEELSEKISIYTEEGNSDESGQYWPIVKQVVLKLPNCDACSSGAILVDLPGIGDTNVARNKKSEEYMKDCAALWIGSVIKRAICDQVARNLLGDNFRRQLHVDGKYGTSDTLAFICTMTDDVNPTEIIRALNLQNETRELQENMGQARDRMKCIERKFKADKAQLDRELREMKEKADSAENLNLHLDPDSSNQKDYDDDLKSKKERIAKLEIEIMDLNAEKEGQVDKIVKEIAGYEKNVAAICALKRNQDSKRVIQQDFKEGLMELKRNRPGGENEETGGGKDGDNLPVFCCSSLEYQKIKEPWSVDGKPKVFSVQEDTQIPDLREYVHTVMSRRKQYFAKKLLKSFRAITLGLKNSISNGNTTSCESFLRVMDDFDEKLKTRILENLSPQIDKLFKDILYNKMLDGAKEAERKAPEICASWSKPVNKNNKTDRSSGGVDWRTYKSTVDRRGEYISKTYARLDFNEQLSSPMLSSYFLLWGNIFNSSNGKLLEILIKMQTDFLMLLDETMQTPFSAEEDQKKEFMDTYSHFTDSLKERALLRLKGMVAEVRDTKLNRHQVIYWLIKPHIQSTLVKAYNDCSQEFGKNMFVRMKNHMSLAVETECHTMFEAAAQKVMEELNTLKKSIMELVERTCTSLVKEFRKNYEQLYEKKSQFTEEFALTIKRIDAEVYNICVEADMEYLEENNPAASSAQL